MRKDANWAAAAVSTETPLARADEAIERLPGRLLTSPIAVHELAVGAKLPIRDIRASVAMGGKRKSYAGPEPYRFWPALIF
jgi:hypothetical protein